MWKEVVWVAKMREAAQSALRPLKLSEHRQYPRSNSLINRIFDLIFHPDIALDRNDLDSEPCRDFFGGGEDGSGELGVGVCRSAGLSCELGDIGEG